MGSATSVTIVLEPSWGLSLGDAYTLYDAMAHPVSHIEQFAVLGADGGIVPMLAIRSLDDQTPTQFDRCLSGIGTYCSLAGIDWRDTPLGERIVAGYAKDDVAASSEKNPVFTTGNGARADRDIDQPK